MKCDKTANIYSKPKVTWHFLLRCLSVCCPHSKISSPQKPLSRLKPNFTWSLPGMGKWKFIQTVLVTWPRWLPCLYTVKTLKNLLLPEPKGWWPLQHRVLEYYQVCSNDDPGLTLTYFTARPNLVPYAFIWEKGKTMDFSETIVVCDIKVGRCS